MSVNVLTHAIEHGVPLVILSPHLDDAALSCGAMMIHAADRTAVTVLTLFTEAGWPPYTLSARQYLRQVGAKSAQALYLQRQAEDRAALEPLGITCVHAGLIEALFRRHPRRRRWAPLTRLLPELAHIYPTYRLHITAGHIAAADAGTLRDVCDAIQYLVGSGPNILLAPLGVGGHADHILVRSAAECSGSPVVYYSDVPYNRRNPVHDTFIRVNGLEEFRWDDPAETKASLVRAYGSQMHALLRSGPIPLVPEIFFSSPSRTGTVMPPPRR